MFKHLDPSPILSFIFPHHFSKFGGTANADVRKEVHEGVEGSAAGATGSTSVAAFSVDVCSSAPKEKKEEAKQSREKVESLELLLDSVSEEEFLVALNGPKGAALRSKMLDKLQKVTKEMENEIHKTYLKAIGTMLTSAR